MSTLKTYTTERRNTIAPREWLEALGADRHIQQADVLVVATSKKAVAELLAGVGMGDESAARIARGSRLQTVLPADWRRAAEAGVITLDRPGVYASVRGGIVNALIVEITDNGTAVPVGKFAWEDKVRQTNLIVVPI